VVKAMLLARKPIEIFAIRLSFKYLNKKIPNELENKRNKLKKNHLQKCQGDVVGEEAG
jgi:hypothetical protein